MRDWMSPEDEGLVGDELAPDELAEILRQCSDENPEEDS